MTNEVANMFGAGIRVQLTDRRRAIAASDFFVFRTPLLAFDELLDFLARHYESRIAQAKRIGRHHAAVTSTTATA